MKANIKQVAFEAGVSTATVSRVLSGTGYVSDEVKAKVQEAVAKLNYRPNAVARSLKQDKTHSLGIIVPDISNPFFMSIARGIEDTVREEGYQLLFCSSDEQPEKERELLMLLNEKRADAILIATSGGNEETIARIAASGVSVLLLDREAGSGLAAELDLIAEDNRHGAYLLTRKLLSSGHTRIGVINGNLNVSTGRDRYEGYLTALGEAGFAVDPAYVVNGKFTVQGGTEAAGYFLGLEARPTAVVSFNNQMTFGLLLELNRRGLRLPSDIMIASYGEVEAAMLLKQPELHYIKQLPYEMGVRAGEILLERLRHTGQETAPAQRMVFMPELSTL
ncbi:Ribose operon repressor [Paenibacillus solanacearum]|uniref:Ribose operon repressor n=1 Tax=Paenibacillus solanacearum TaxID=2048548 RepID=A0A916JYL8_9BACL|nr:LacI family DNA-binding transcriptional regulator [Paenibacillus solanacearum]CAG7615934.1 Ribose operon repressor [Paenibacillus solanacearum]